MVIIVVVFVVLVILIVFFVFIVVMYKWKKKVRGWFNFCVGFDGLFDLIVVYLFFNGNVN